MCFFCTYGCNSLPAYPQGVAIAVICSRVPVVRTFTCFSCAGRYVGGVPFISPTLSCWRVTVLCGTANRSGTAFFQGSTFLSF
eukprot:5407429-Pleurochrysis_carterae.AAC.1